MGAIFWGGGTPFESAEVKFSDNSASGLQIMPASCASSVEHWSGECSMPSSCVITVTPNSYASGSVSSLTVHWETPQPPASYDSQIASINGNVTSIGAVFPSGTLNVVAPASSMTYTFNGAYLNSSGTTLGTFSCSAPVNVGGAPPTYSLLVNQELLYRSEGSSVSRGDYINYRIYMRNTGADQGDFTILDHIPSGTHLTWQGGGTTNSVGAANSGGVPDGGGNIWWIQTPNPAGWNGYVDFQVQVDATSGQICNTPYYRSEQFYNGGAGYPANMICNPVVQCVTYLEDATVNPQGYKVGAYAASGKRGDRNTPPICVSNTSDNSYFIPAKTSSEIEQFKAHLPPGASYQNI